MLPSTLLALTLVPLCGALPVLPKQQIPSLEQLLSMLPDDDNYCHNAMAFNKTDDRNHAGLSNTTVSHPTQGSTLDNEIHPLFNHAYWFNWLPMEVAHTKMRPALQLVSLFLTTPGWQDWYVRIKKDNLTTSPNSFILRGDVLRASDDDRAESIKDWEELSGAITFAFHGASKNLQQVLGAYWEKCPLPQLNGHRDEWDNTAPTLFLHEGFYCRLVNIDSFSPLENSRFQFSLATVILHELGHAWYSKWQNHDEPSEMGFSWEEWAFGTRLEQTDILEGGMMHATGSFETRDFQDIFPVQRDVFAAVPDAWILRWFDKTTWQNASAMRQSEEFYPPSTSAHPEKFKALRFHNDMFGNMLYHRSMEDNTTRAYSADVCDTEHPHPDCPSVRRWYEHVWDRESEEAFEKRRLPFRFLYPVYYQQFLGEYKPPVWARAKLQGMGLWHDEQAKGGSNVTSDGGSKSPILF